MASELRNPEPFYFNMVLQTDFQELNPAIHCIFFVFIAFRPDDNRWYVKKQKRMPFLSGLGFSVPLKASGNARSKT